MVIFSTPLSWDIFHPCSCYCFFLSLQIYQILCDFSPLYKGAALTSVKCLFLTYCQKLSNRGQKVFIQFLIPHKLVQTGVNRAGQCERLCYFICTNKEKIIKHYLIFSTCIVSTGVWFMCLNCSLCDL